MQVIFNDLGVIKSHVRTFTRVKKRQVLGVVTRISEPRRRRHLNGTHRMSALIAFGIRIAAEQANQVHIQRRLYHGIPNSRLF